MELPDTYKQKLNVYNDQFYYAMDDLEKSYINTMLYPDNNEYNQIYSKQMGTVESIESNVFIITNNIQKNIDDLNNNLKNVNNKIKNEQLKNNNLKDIKNGFKSDGNGSELMIQESKQMYNEQRYTNITMLVGIFLLMTAIIKINS